LYIWNHGYDKKQEESGIPMNLPDSLPPENVVLLYQKRKDLDTAASFLIMKVVFSRYQGETG
jgi:hypothetical protein